MKLSNYCLQKIAWLAIFLLSACDNTPDVIPQQPEQLIKREEGQFGTRARSLDIRLWAFVWDQGVELFGREGMKQRVYAMSADTDWQQLKRAYAEQLAADKNWKEEKRLKIGFLDGSDPALGWMFAFSHGNYFIFVTGLDPSLEFAGYIPVSVSSNLPGFRDF